MVSVSSPGGRRRRSVRLSTSDESVSVSSPYVSGSGSGMTSLTTSTTATDATAFSEAASSRTSQMSSFCPPEAPITPRPMSSRSSRHSFGAAAAVTSSGGSGHRRRKSSRASIGSINSTISQQFGGGAKVADTAGLGLGNLADELAEAADIEEDENGPLSPSFLEGLREGDQEEDGAVFDQPVSPYVEGDSASIPKRNRSRRSKSTNHLSSTNNNHEIMPSYDGSDYGPGSESEDGESGLQPYLRKRMRSIEQLVHDYDGEGYGYEDEDEDEDDGRSAVDRDMTMSMTVISHLTQSLHSLGPTQANIEYGVTRLLTACNSIATHRTHAQRDLFSTSHALMYGHRIYTLPIETLDLLASELDSLAETLPILSELPPHTDPDKNHNHNNNNNNNNNAHGPVNVNNTTDNPLLSLRILANETNSLISTLRSLTDLLQETRQATNAASRKLKTVRDMVEELRVDKDLVENSMLLIQAGDWDRRCRERQAARVCREVVGGFGEMWGIDTPDATQTPGTDTGTGGTKGDTGSKSLAGKKKTSTVHLHKNSSRSKSSTGLGVAAA